MKFTHDFAADLEMLLAKIDSGEPFAYSRFADGEWSIINRQQVPTADGWTLPDQGFSTALEFALKQDHPNLHLGLSCPCCDAEANSRLRSLATIPEDRVTFSTLFVNANHKRFGEWLGTVDRLTGFTLVGPWPMADVRIPINAVNSRWWQAIAAWAARTICDRPLPALIAAGPLTNIIIHYALLANRNAPQLIDIGSALSGIMTHFGMPSIGLRNYHNPSHPNRSKVCRWE